ncbi:MAG: PAS domain S-box protein [Desulforhabdus sp.]|jgi:PAS domain S-box-containing protein|nr:PAS domain S-box protein [Desulforhabdus sp.]
MVADALKSLKVVIIEDEEPHFELMRRALHKEMPHISIHHFDEARTCLENLETVRPDIIIVDYLMPGMNGIEFIAALHSASADVPVIMITGQGDENIAVCAMKMGASDYLVKSTDFFTLLPSIVERVVRERRLKESLNETERRFKDLAECISDWIWELDAEGKYTYSNPIVEKILGYRPDEVRGMHFYDFFAKKEKEAQRGALFKLMMAGQPINNFTNYCNHKDGQEIILETSGVPILDNAGNLVGYRGIDRDITRRKRAQEALRESEERFRNIYEESPIGIEIFDREGFLIDANKACLDIFGVPDLSVPKVNLFEDANIPEDVIKKLLDGESVRIETRFDFNSVRNRKLYETTRSGTIQTDIVITPMGDNGTTTGYLVQVQDITDRKRAEQALRLSHRFLEIGNKNIEMAVLLREFVAEIKHFTGCSAAGIRILDDDRAVPYLAYDGFSRLFYETDNPAAMSNEQCMWISVITEKLNGNLPFYTPGGSFYMNAATQCLASVPEQQHSKMHSMCKQFGYESAALLPIRIGDHIIGLIHIADFQTDMVPLETLEVLEAAAMELGTAINRVRTREALRQARDELEIRVRERTMELARANEKLQDEIDERKKIEDALRKSSEDLKLFAYSIMHDLKSPAVGIYGLSRLLQKQYGELVDDRGKSYCNQIAKASEHVAALVEKINVFISSKESPLEIEKINVNKLLQMIKDEFSARCRVRGINWIEPEPSVEIYADQLALLRVIRNFVDNALKYGGENLSEIKIGYEESEQFHILSVSDDGVGIKSEDRERIFGLFQRNVSSREVEGTGLGLNIVREIAERHGGRIWVEPGPRRGTTFFVSISKELAALGTAGG